MIILEYVYLISQVLSIERVFVPYVTVTSMDSYL